MKVGRSENYGKGAVNIDESLFDTNVEQKKLEIAEKVKRVIDSDDYQPPLLPEVAISLTQLASQPNVDFGDVERVVSKDPVVAAKIVAVANSAFYSRGQPVRSLALAIARLGLSAVRDVAFQVVAQTTIFRAKGYLDRMRELYGAAQFAGRIAKEICQKLRFESEMAYLCGLLHDMGEALILGVIGDICKKEKVEPYPMAEIENAVELLHAQVGARVCMEWGLPNLLCDAIRFHHRCEESTDPSQMATVIAVTDILLAHIGVGVPQKEVNSMEEPLFYKLNLQPAQVEDLISFSEYLLEQEDNDD